MNMYSYNCCNNKTTESEKILSQLALIKLLSDKNRLQILCILTSESHCVSELIQHVQASQSLVSHHLITLKKLQLVTARKSGRHVFYSLTKKGTYVVKLLKILSTKEAA